MMTSRGQKILQITLAQAQCNEISEKPAITSHFPENAFVDANTEEAEIVMEIYPATNNVTDIPQENLKVLATGCGNASEDIIALNNDVYNTIFFSKNNVSSSISEEILRENIDESKVPENSPEHFVQSSRNDKNNEFETTSNIIFQHNDDGPHYRAAEVDASVLHKEVYTEAEDPSYLPDESSDTNELEEQEEEVVEILDIKGKKRKRNIANWKKNIRKQKKAAGEEYLSATNKLIGKNEMRPPCRDECRKQCKQNISVESRALIHLQFWNGTIELDQKRQFIASCIEEVPVERVRARTGSRAGKRMTSLKYFFSVNGKRLSVCRTYFLNTLNISQTTVRNALLKRQLGGIVTPDQRGKHEPSNKIAANVRNDIREHIQKFPCVESHYSRNKSQRMYLGSHLNISIMYRCFYEECVERQIPKEYIPKQWLYNEIFNSEFNLAFKEPGNDTCDTCDGYVIKLKESVSLEERLELQTNYDSHLFDADHRYKLKRLDKETSKTEANTKILSVDLQKCLPTPLLTNAQSFYSIKLWTFNYTVYDAIEKLGYCFTWDESIARRGGNEMASCILKYINLNVKESVERIVIWSDNCPSQNRNIQMIMCYLSILKLKPSIKCIEHKYLLRGHTHMEVDTIHARRERQKKASSQFSLITPWDWQQLFRLCDNKLEVAEMETMDFKNFTLLSEDSGFHFQNNKKMITNQNFLISKVVHMKFLAESPGVLHFKTNFNQENFEQVDFNRAAKRLPRKGKCIGNSKEVVPNTNLILKPIRNLFRLKNITTCRTY
ncbi:uncharacterized protein LOC126883199 isoform X1 [Diabrotica virgifera virgifera]|uniref:DUF7869 domain-containing protein n=1 Tax=Diabrotica virgifera virgifera TaxID=50390 RepID=A0ABM5K2J2_DIAVI|nr:uncharacterized protein LOC126883199 isoform X1 [Diabrotica virgifera virgifera]